MDNEIKHGLDLPNEEADKIHDYLIKKFGITEEDINGVDDEGIEED